MAPQLIPPNRSLMTIREAILYSRTRLAASALTSKLATPHDDLLTDWAKLFARELQLVDARVAAGAQIDELDAQLDTLVDRLSALLLARIGQDRSHPTYRHYFKSGRPSDVKRPVLGRELETVKAWVATLVASTEAELKAVGQELDKLVQAAEKAERAFTEATDQMAAFRNLGERKSFLDKVNRVRQAAFGDLQQIRLGPQGEALPTDFAASFFQRRSEAAPTLDGLRAELAERERELTELKARIQQLEAEEGAAARARLASERLEKEALLKEGEAELVALQARLTALKTELGRDA